MADVENLLGSDILTAEQMMIAQQCLAMAMHVDTLQVRCYLEVEQIDLARAMLDDCKSYYRSTNKAANRALARQSSPRDVFSQVDEQGRFIRYIMIEEWLRDSDNVLFDLIIEQRDRFWDSKVTSAMKHGRQTKSAVQKLGAMLWPKQTKKQQLPIHLLALEQIEELIENFERFEGFALEIADLQRRNRLASAQEHMSFARWNRLADTEHFQLDQHDDFVCIVDAEELQKADKLGW